MLFNDFTKKYSLKIQATSNTEIQQVLSFLFLNDVRIYLRDGIFSSDITTVNLHPSKGKHLICYNKENFSDSYGCSLPNKLSKFSIKRKVYCLYSDHKIQCLTNKKDSHRTSYCLYLYYTWEKC